MKAKTAIQELIEIIYSEPIDNLNGHYLILKAKELLKKEKQQIIDANNAGWRTHRRKEDQSAEDYYNETFGEI